MAETWRTIASVMGWCWDRLTWWRWDRCWRCGRPVWGAYRGGGIRLLCDREDCDV